MKNTIETLLQKHPLLKETDLYEEDDPVTGNIIYQSLKQPQSSHIIHSLLAEIQHHQFDDSHISHDVLTTFENSLTLGSNNDSATLTETSHSNAIIHTPIKPSSTSSLPFYDPSVFTHCKAFEISFLSSDSFSSIPILLQDQKDDLVLSTG